MLIRTYLSKLSSDADRYVNLNLEDRLDKKGSLLSHIDGGLKFIYSAREEGEKILVHCIEGKSRSYGL